MDALKQEMTDGAVTNLCCRVYNSQTYEDFYGLNAGPTDS